MKLLFLPLISSGLAILASSYWFNFPYLILFSLVPLFIFFLKEQKLLNLILGTFLFKYTFLIISFHPALTNNIYLLLFIAFLFSFVIILPFLGFPLSFYFLRKKCQNFSFLLFILPFLWTF